jgi:kynurenine formamidase
MIDLKNYRIVDLSAELRPGVLKVNGEYLHAGQPRRLEVRQFVYAPDKMLMHWVETETHIGTHVEGPSHHPKGNRCLVDLPLETFIGEALVLDFSHLKPQGGHGQSIKPKDLENVRAGDIVLMRSPYSGREMPFISPEAARTLAKKGIKMLGIQGIGVEAEGSTETHDSLLLHDIPIIEGLVNLDKLSRDRVFFIGLPLKIRDIDSSWIRAVALEPL